MTAVVEPGRLPGGLSVWRGYALLAGANAAFLAMPVLLMGGYVVGALLVYGPAFALLLLVYLAIVANTLWSRPGVRVLPSNQPELVALVADVATTLGHRPPDRIWLTGRPSIEARVSAWRRDLYVGEPLLDGLTSDEVRALVAHELSVLQPDQAWLGTRLLRAWTLAGWKVELAKGRARRRDVRIRAALDPFVLETHRRADAAAATIGRSAEVAARAVVFADAADGRHGSYVLLDASAPRRKAFRTPVILDINDGWRRRLARGVSDTIWDENAAELASVHPGLASAIRRLAGDITLSMPEDRVRTAPLEERERRRIVRRLLKLPGRQAVRWTTFADAPPQWWVHRAAASANGLRKDVARVLGRPPLDDVETAAVLLGRNDEIMAQTLDIPVDVADDEPPQPWTPDLVPPVFGDLVEAALLPRGWRLEHPAVRGMLIGPDGRRLEANTLVAGTTAEPDLTAYRDLLDATQPAPVR